MYFCHLFCVLTLLPRDAIRRARYCYGKSSVRLSVYLSVRDIGWNSSKIISRYLHWVFALRKTPTSRIYSKGNTRNFGRNRGGMPKKWLSAYKSSNISEMRQDSTIGLLLMTNRKSYTCFRLVAKSTTLDDLEGSLCTLFQNTWMLLFIDF